MNFFSQSSEFSKSTKSARNMYTDYFEALGYYLETIDDWVSAEKRYATSLREISQKFQKLSKCSAKDEQMYLFMRSHTSIQASHHEKFASDLKSDIWTSMKIRMDDNLTTYKDRIQTIKNIDKALEQIEKQIKETRKARRRDMERSTINSNFVNSEIRDQTFTNLINSQKGKYSSIENAADELKIQIKNDMKVQFEQIMDDIKKVFIHNISMIKNKEYDTNHLILEFNEFEELEQVFTDVTTEIRLPEIDFELDETNLLDISTMDLKSNSNLNMSLADSFVSLFSQPAQINTSRLEDKGLPFSFHDPIIKLTITVSNEQGVIVNWQEIDKQLEQLLASNLNRVRLIEYLNHLSMKESTNYLVSSSVFTNISRYFRTTALILEKSDCFIDLGKLVYYTQYFCFKNTVVESPNPFEISQSTEVDLLGGDTKPIEKPKVQMVFLASEYLKLGFCQKDAFWSISMLAFFNECQSRLNYKSNYQIFKNLLIRNFGVCCFCFGGDHQRTRIIFEAIAKQKRIEIDEKIEIVFTAEFLITTPNFVLLRPYDKFDIKSYKTKSSEKTVQLG